jgi:hypothetical protein
MVQAEPLASTSLQTAEEVAEDRGQRSPWFRGTASHHLPFSRFPRRAGYPFDNDCKKRRCQVINRCLAAIGS